MPTRCSDRPSASVRLDDVHARLNATLAAQVCTPRDRVELQRIVAASARERAPFATMGARHAMGGQQFLAGGRVIDTAALDRVLAFDATRGTVVVEAGIRWPQLLRWLDAAPDNAARWTIRQKQTGADDFSVGGAASANIHGRGLTLAPFVDDVLALDLVDPNGRLQHAARAEQPELFAAAMGGYGLFGVIAAVHLQLVPRTTLVRRVQLLRRAQAMPAFDAAIAAGARYGDFQFAVDPAGDDFLDRGIMSCYYPAPGRTPDPAPRHLRRADFAALLQLAHTDPAAAFERYADFYLGSDGQHYGSDAQQLGIDLGDYHAAIDRMLCHRGSEMITELYVPRERLDGFLAAAADTLRRHAAHVIYGTVRLIEAETTTLLAWARAPWACIVFNLHVRHDAAGIAAARRAFGGLIDCALERGGTFYLTYHRWATRAQLEAGYPQFGEFLRRKRAHDPHELLQSDWYRHCCAVWNGADA